jgi:hypothetical protein
MWGVSVKDRSPSEVLTIVAYCNKIGVYVCMYSWGRETASEVEFLTQTLSCRITFYPEAGGSRFSRMAVTLPQYMV